MHTLSSVLSVCLDHHPSVICTVSPTSTSQQGSVYYISSLFGPFRQGPRCPPSARISWLFSLTSPAGPRYTSASGFCFAETGSKGESGFSGLARSFKLDNKLCLRENKQKLRTRAAMLHCASARRCNQAKNRLCEKDADFSHADLCTLI